MVWAALQFLNIAWPRVAFEQRYLDWSVWIGVAVLGVIGAVLLRERASPGSCGDRQDACDEPALADE